MAFPIGFQGSTGGFSQNFGKPNPALFFTTSGSSSITASGTYRVSLVGAGGSGASAMSSASRASAGGGGGGGFCEIEVILNQGDVVTFVLGAAGQPVTTSVDNTGTAGQDGGTSTVTGPGFLLTAYGGKGGATGISNATGTANGGLGGSATGGTINKSGGRGGNGTTFSSGTAKAAGGGGASGSPMGDGGRGGDATCVTSGFSSASGGGAVGGFRGGDCAPTASSRSSGGGGTGGAGGDVTTGGSTASGNNALGMGQPSSADGWPRASGANPLQGFDSLNNPFRAMTGGGTGSGGGGNPLSGATSHAGICGGGGGNALLTYGGDSMVGGGSGGVAHTASCASGYAGKSLCTIERIA